MSTTRYRQGCRKEGTQHGLHSFAQQQPSFTIRGYSLETIPKYATEQKPAIQVTARTSPHRPQPNLKQLQSRSTPIYNKHAYTVDVSHSAAVVKSSGMLNVSTSRNSQPFRRTAVPSSVFCVEQPRRLGRRA